MGPSGTAETAARILIAGVIVNVGLGVFNLVPLPPLDGAWVASFGLPPRMGESYDRVVRPYGTWILLILVLSGALSAITSPVIGFLIRWLYKIALP
jgi:Zn-dependent protease